MILRYLVINEDLFCNVFKFQSVWIHYKENRHHLSGITVCAFGMTVQNRMEYSYIRHKIKVET